MVKNKFELCILKVQFFYVKCFGYVLLNCRQDICDMYKRLRKYNLNVLSLKEDLSFCVLNINFNIGVGQL